MTLSVDTPEFYRHRVSSKIALYSSDLRHVLIVEYDSNNFGLPGGHLDANEEPEDALRRELQEELGIVYTVPVIKHGFWRHPSGKIILGFIGMLDMSTKLIIDHHELSAAKWVEVEDVINGVTSVGVYDQLIREGVTALHKTKT